MKRLFSIFAFALLAASSGLAKTFIIDISTGRPAVSNEAYYHGETIAFRAVCGGEAVTNIAYACIYYQTNGMGNVWWKTDGLVFHPTNDVGAASYRFFLEGRDDLGRDWHANGLLRLINSPGFTPNAVTPPVQTLNFDGIEVSNAPWPTFEEVDDTVSNALENLVTEESDPVWLADKDNYVTTQDFEDEISTWFRSTNAWISVSNGVLRVWEVASPTNILRYEWDMRLASVTGNVARLEAAMPRKIEDSHDWAKWTASGVSNSFGAVMLDKGATYFGSTNVVWTMSGGFAVLTSFSMPVTASGSANQFRIGIDADDWFGFEVAASYLIAAIPTGFSRDNTQQTVTFATEYDESYETIAPHVYFAASLGESFVEVEAARCSWTHVSGGNSTVVVSNVSGTAGFFILKREMAGGTIMRSTMPFLPEGYRVENAGSYVGTVQPDSIVTIEVNGRQYRIFAEEVQ